MEDNIIVELYWQRSESAITESNNKYGRMLNSISYSLVSSHEDAAECVNDTYLAAWNSMPSERPTYLGAFLSKIVRRISVSSFRNKHREKRGGFGNIIEELSECIPSSSEPQTELENGFLSNFLNSFLAELSEEKRYIFLRRYFYSDSIDRISSLVGKSESSIKTTLFRIRETLKTELEKEGLL